jgi:hypothetical protein
MSNDITQLLRDYACDYTSTTYHDTLINEAANEIESLRQQLEASQKREVMLREKFQELADNFVWNGDDHSYQHWVIEVSQSALAATADLDGLILCEKEPIGDVTDSLGELAVIMYPRMPPAGTKLYRAWEPK